MVADLSVFFTVPIENENYSSYQAQMITDCRKLFLFQQDLILISRQSNIAIAIYVKRIAYVLCNIFGSSKFWPYSFAVKVAQQQQQPKQYLIKLANDIES